MSNEILDDNKDSDNYHYHCHCQKKSIKEKLVDILITLAVWIPCFFIMEEIMEDYDNGKAFRTAFYAGAVLGYIICILITPIYKNK
jgi:succinate dehydrogenase hydrophobic anchor subunit